MGHLLSVSALVEGKKGVCSLSGRWCSIIQGQASSPCAKIGRIFQIRSSDLASVLPISWNPFHYLFAVWQILLIHAYFKEWLGTLKEYTGKEFSSKHCLCLKIPRGAHTPSILVPVTSSWWGHSIGTGGCGSHKPPGRSEMLEPYGWWSWGG